MADLEARIETLEGTIAALKESDDARTTELDAIIGRLEGAERTVQAMADSLASASPANVEAVTDDIATIKSKVNEFYAATFGAGPDLPFPPAPSTPE